MCTIVTIAKNDVVLAGNNEDYTEPRTKIWFVPASKEAYGRVYVGYDHAIVHSRFQGGMNDQGLFIDINAVAPTGWQADPRKLNFNGDIIEHVLSYCSTVDEAVDFFQQNNVPDLERTRIPVADAKGDSVIIEWAKGKVQFLFKKGFYQISTNFIQSNYDNPDEYPCARYKIADHILENAKTPSVDLIRSVLSATHFEYFGQTLYSNICDLKKRRIYLYFFHNFEEAVIFDLEKELKKGKMAYPIDSLFATKPFAAHLFEQIGPQIGAKAVIDIVNERGIKEGIDQFSELRKQSRQITRYIFEEWVLRDVGLIFLSKKRMKEAIEIFKLNSQLYPKSRQVYKDLADAYVRNGQRKLAARNYEKAKDLNPTVDQSDGN